MTKTPRRDELFRLISGLDQTNFGYAARHQYYQLAGYLIVDKNQSEIGEKTGFNVHKIRQEELQLISSFHAQLAVMSKQCVSTLLVYNPNLWGVVNPYELAELEEPLLNDVRFDEGIVHSLREAFSQHPSIQALISEPIRDFDPLQLRKQVASFEKSIFSQDEPPEALKRLIFASGKKSEERRALRFLANLAVLRASLTMLNQLIFQALISNKLVAFDEDLIIELRQHSNISGHLFELLALMNGHSFRVEVNDLVLLVALDNQPSQLAWVQSSSFQMSQETGDTVLLDLRKLDDHLSLFGSLQTLA